MDVYTIFALGLAAVFARVAVQPALRWATTMAIGLLCALSMFQMLQYWHGVLPAADLTWQGYRDVFLRTW